MSDDAGVVLVLMFDSVGVHAFVEPMILCWLPKNKFKSTWLVVVSLEWRVAHLFFDGFCRWWKFAAGGRPRSLTLPLALALQPALRVGV